MRLNKTDREECRRRVKVCNLEGQSKTKKTGRPNSWTPSRIHCFYIKNMFKISALG